MAEIKKQKNYFDKTSRKGKMTNVPMGATGFGGSSTTKNGKVFKNNLLDADLTSQTATRRKLK